MTGWEWDNVDRTMTMPRLQALQGVWDMTPPPAQTLTMLAQSKGFKPAGRKKKKPSIEKNENVGAALELAKALKGM